MIVRRRDLDKVHSDQVRSQRDLADRPEQVGGLHAARLGGARPRREPGVEHVDIHREIDQLGTIERFGDRLVDNRLDASIEQLAHQVPAHPLRAHPLEGLALGPVAAQPDLHEVAPGDGARFDQPAHGRGVRSQVAPAVAAGVGVRVKVQDAYLAPAVGVGYGGCRRVGDRVIAPDHHGHDLPRGDFGDPRSDRLVGLVGHPRVADRVAIVDDLQDLKGRHLQVEVPAGRLIVRDPHGPGAETGARPVGRRIVPGCADDGDIRAPLVELLRLTQRARFEEGRRTEVLGTVHLGIEVGGCRHSPTILAASSLHAYEDRLGRENMKRLPIVLITVAMTLAACGGSSAGPAASSSGPAKVASIAAEVPSSVPTPIQIATDATYSPDEYIDPTTGDIIVWDIDLGKAICEVMGVACTFNNVTFDSIIPQLTATNPRYVLGISSFTPTAEREAKGIDFVSYYKAGEGWVVAASSSITLHSAADMCGHTIAVETGTTEETDA